ncbi:23S rRNA (adenine(2030)-N(6))-methyltransferase RlmJ [Salmonella enterica subsp. enterica]|nr:23S rRNA (adenine(2030)-N(6))-methyltransferase RlmJ [Salmonella enterica subsp. enterica]
MRSSDDLPAELEPYISVVNISTAAGSYATIRPPLIARQLLREQDSLQPHGIAVPSDFPTVARARSFKDNRARVERRRLSATEKPNCRRFRRGLILIIRLMNENRLPCGSQRYSARVINVFATGTYALWYPAVLRQQIAYLSRELEATASIRKSCKLSWRSARQRSARDDGVRYDHRG